MQELHISVRNLVEFIFRAGDIDNRAGKLASAEAMMEGSRIHRKIQKSMDTSYQAEVPLKIEWKANDYVLVVEGRADGIAYGKFQSDLPAATESVLQPEMEFAAEIPPEEEISSGEKFDHLPGNARKGASSVSWNSFVDSQNKGVDTKSVHQNTEGWEKDLDPARHLQAKNPTWDETCTRVQVELAGA